MNTPVILLVDDERPVLNSLRRILTPDGYLLLDATDGQSALAILEAREVDLVLADQRMPGMSGVELLERVRREHPDVLTMMLTAHADMEVVLRAMNELGVYKYFLKPWSAENLRAAIRRGIELRRQSDGAEARNQKARDQDAILRQWEKDQPGITKVKRNADGVYILAPEDLGDANPVGDPP